MSDKKIASTPQPPPVRNGNPSCHDLVLKDLIERRAFGIDKYGVTLQPGNGRDFKVDLYQELLDACVYIRGVIFEEEQNKPSNDLEPGVEFAIRYLRLLPSTALDLRAAALRAK